MALITADEYENLTNEDITDLPAAYRDYTFEAVSQHVQTFCGKAFTSTSFTEKSEALFTVVTGSPVLVIEPLVLPVTEVTSVDLWFYIGTDPNSLNVSKALVDNRAGRIMIPFGIFGTWRSLYVIGQRYQVETTYTAGDSGGVPDAVKRAVALLAQEQFSNDAQVSREQTGQVVKYNIHLAYSEERPVIKYNQGQLGLGTQNSAAAAALLDGYRASGAVMI